MAKAKEKTANDNGKSKKKKGVKHVSKAARQAKLKGRSG